jgi:bifunctional aspartokinase / homoserine dehydrogenase 1
MSSENVQTESPAELNADGDSRPPSKRAAAAGSVRKAPHASVACESFEPLGDRASLNSLGSRVAPNPLDRSLWLGSTQGLASVSPLRADPSVDLADGRDSIVAFKFGGSSLLGAQRMLHAASLVRPVAQATRVVVVVSAMKGVTDRLLAIARALATRKNQRARAEAQAVLHLHRDVLRDLPLQDDHRDRVSNELESLGRDLLHEVPGHGHVSAPPELFDRLASFGERLSARLFAAALERSGVPAVPVSSSEFVLTCETFQDAKPHLEQTKRRGRAVLSPLLEDGIVPVVTGFIGATPDGRITTMGRNSSDFSGAIIAHVVDADELVIWTDVDGIYTANPSEFAQAKLLHDLSYDEAHALAATGAKVLHPHVLPLAAETQMTVWVRNTFKPHVRGTRIGLRRAFDNPSQHGGAA